MAAAATAFMESDDGSGFIFLLLLSGPAFFFFNYLRYRNKDKRHRHESETPTRIENLRSYDNLIEHKKGCQSKTIQGENSMRVSGSVVGAKDTSFQLTENGLNLGGVVDVQLPGLVNMMMKKK
jgi:hypothetical protein